MSIRVSSLALSLSSALALTACDDQPPVTDEGTTSDGSTSTGPSVTTTGDDSTSSLDSETTATVDPTTTTTTTTSEEGSSSSGEPVVCAPELGLYADAECSTLAEGIQAFEPEHKLWSDGLVKTRFVSLPDTIDTSDPDYWTFPVGTVMWKHFETAEGQRLETRRMEKTADDIGPDAWEFETFVWNEAGDDVEAVQNGAQNVLGTDHDIPAVDDCSECHNGGEVDMMGMMMPATHDIVLGFSALQLNHAGSDVTLDSLAADGMLSSDIATGDAVIPGNAVARAALGTLHANCGHCHGGDNPSGNMRLFVEVGLGAVEQTATYAETVGVAIGMSPVMDIPPFRILAGDPDQSAVPWRMEHRDGNGMGAAQMPPLATEVVDEDGVAAVEAWITSLAS